MKRTLASVILLLLLAACVGMPDNVRPVEGFDAGRYLGTWYEIARLDHPFERGLTNVTAHYSLRADGGLKVVNRGYSAGEKRWKEAEGRAYFVDRPDRGFLKVSFFGPFYGSYVVFELDRDHYRYALVSGPDKTYFWILARDPKMSGDLKESLIAKAAALGFDTSGLILVDHE